MEERVFGGRYRVTGTLGHGGMASVYRAVDEQLGREVAVKVFRIGAVDHGERARAEAEMHTLAALRSPSLVTLYDAALDDGNGDSYLVMELVPGSDLDTRLREGPLDTTTTARTGAQVAEGLAAVHAQGIVHRDVKPANVLLESDGQHVKLADFGIALLRDAARVTGTGTVIGTAAYISPEQVLGREVTGQADVYALGLVLLQCLTGERPFPGTAVESATARLTRGPDIDQHLPTAWRTLLHVMTAQDPAERPTAAEAARRLRALERDGTAPATQLLPGGPGTLTRAAGGAAGAGVGLAGAALGAGGPDAAHADQATQAVPGAVDGDQATRAMRTAGGADAATRAYDRTGAQDDVATTVLGAQRGAGGAGAAAAAGGGAVAGGAASRGAGGPAGAAGRGGPGTDGSKRRRAGIITAVVVGILVLAGIGVALFALGGGDDSTPAPTDSSEPSSPTEQQTSEPEQQPSQEQQQPSEPAQEPSEPAEEPTEEQQPSEPAQEPSQPADDPSVGPQPGGPASNPVEAPQGGAGNSGNGNGPGSNSGKGKGSGAADTTVDTTVGSLTQGPATGPGRG
ncbi:serine/threonine-protein kinase [Curtobacterium sp. 260]|uniref:serine/threonine-protein kinase n=1 Tax=Curtobacterium sp. 260 TaxID=2817748 RepID=UPI00278762FB|nr:protein kinase [Curtobacterium sp. 260]MDP9736025.1 tRNA A-37 threonylcarbamoyl transferase component Bud32 [Curtobacterium sp. 260]